VRANEIPKSSKNSNRLLFLIMKLKICCISCSVILFQDMLLGFKFYKSRMIQFDSYKYILICYFESYLIKMLLNFAMFLSAIPVPRTTALNGSSAIYTGKSVFCEIRLSRPLNIDPPPAR
jgi:hypothetical protein